MSKIHEALKQAELEKASAPPSTMDPNTAELAEVGTAGQSGVLPKASDAVSTSGTAELGDVADPLTLEVINTQVRKSKWNPNPTTMLFLGQETYTPGTEEFRTLRSALYAIRDLRPLRTLLIASAIPGEGKSFIAANLAQVFAQQPDRRVLLIDGDLRWSRLHYSLGAPLTPGLTDYLAGEASELSILQRGLHDNLFFIAGGKHAQNPAELITNGRLHSLLLHLSPVFDWIIIDSPPAMAVSDPRVTSDLCDGVLLVVGVAMAPYEAIKKTRQQFDKERLLGVVLNRTEPRMSYNYKYYGYYQDRGKNGKGKGRG